MTWKTYTAVSGATVLAGWLVSTPPSSAPTSTGSTNGQAASRPDAPASDIEREAQRLQGRVRREVEYAQPRRNPFRFGEGVADADRGGDIPAPASEAPVAVPVVPPPLPVSLSGIAEDQVGQQVERTAILSSPSGVLLVKEGDDIGGGYRIGRVESEAVELVKIDGTTLRLTLKP
jgi:hypothetical protein